VFVLELQWNDTGADVDAAALNGQVVASLSGLQRTIDDYDNLARKELVEDKREKALRCVHITVGRHEQYFKVAG
jgi:hypothetical protein